jgi:hypothetical protein
MARGKKRESDACGAEQSYDSGDRNRHSRSLARQTL